jgi:prefoldin alpha subunit
MGRADEVGREILIPLTSSLYIPGRLTDVENVVIDVGTGYYVKKVSCLARGEATLS